MVVSHMRDWPPAWRPTHHGASAMHTHQSNPINDVQPVPIPTTRGPTEKASARIGKGIEWVGRLSPALATRMLWRLWFTPRQVLPNARARELLASADARFEVFAGDDGVLVHSWGQGPTVLLLHGWSGYGGQLGSFAKSLVQAGYRVILFDAPAHATNRRRQFTLEEYASVVSAVVQHAGDVQAIIGHSLGATAAAIAICRLGRAIDLVAIAPSANLQTLLRSFQNTLGLSETRMADLRRAFEAYFGSNVWSAYSLDHLVTQLSGRVLLVHDHDDIVAHHSNSLYLKFLREDVDLLTTHGMGHNRILHTPAVINAVREFVTFSAAPIHCNKESATAGVSS